MQGPSLQHLGEAEAPGFIPGGSFFEKSFSTKSKLTANLSNKLIQTAQQNFCGHT